MAQMTSMLRSLLARDQILVAPGAHDVLTARIIEREKGSKRCL